MPLSTVGVAGPSSLSPPALSAGALLWLQPELNFLMTDYGKHIRFPVLRKMPVSLLPVLKVDCWVFLIFRLRCGNAFVLLDVLSVGHVQTLSPTCTDSPPRSAAVCRGTPAFLALMKSVPSLFHLRALPSTFYLGNLCLRQICGEILLSSRNVMVLTFTFSSVTHPEWFLFVV